MMIQRVGSWALLAGGILLSVACSADQIMCPAALPGSAIHVEVLDGATGENIVEIASGEIIRSGYLEEQYRFRAPLPYPPEDPPKPPFPYLYLIGNGNGPGRYDVNIRAPGYQAWSKQRVLVESRGKKCGLLKEVVLTARLVPDT